MKVLIDDQRSRLPDGSTPDLIIRNFDTAAWFFGVWSDKSNDELYLDHDLGDKFGENILNGYSLICQIEAGVHYGTMTLPRKIVCMSDNPPGRFRIQQVIDKLYGDRENENVPATLEKE